jgi:hypothetical protein
MAQTIVTLSGDDAELYKAFQRIIDQQLKTDAGYKKVKDASKEAANAAKAAAKEQADAEKERQKRVDSAIGSVTNLVAAYVSVSAAVTAASEAHTVLIGNQDKALSKAKELAAAQQEAAKNLAGQTPQQISDTLQRTVPEIAKETQFADLAKLTTALGSAASIVGEQQARGVVTESARITRFTPDQLQTTATATADIMAATGLDDAKQALALLASTGSVARPEELAKLAQGAAAAVNAAIAQAPAQDKVDAAKEGVALYAKLTKVDPQGQSAATATTDFIRQISAVFADPKLVKDRTERIETLRLGQTDNQLALQQATLKVQETGRTAGFFKPNDTSIEAETARLNVQKAQQDMAQANLKIKRDADELKRLEAIQTVTTGVSPTEEKRRDLTAQMEALRAEASQSITQKFPALAKDSPESIKAMADRPDLNMAPAEFGDLPERFRKVFTELQTVTRGAIEEKPTRPVPTTFLDRLEAVRTTPELRAAVTETMTGEAKFQPLFKQLLDGNSELSKELGTALNTVTTDTKAFAQVAQSTVETPQARVVAAANQVETALNIQQSTDTEGQVRAAVSQIFTDAMNATAVDMTTGLGSVVSRNVVGVSRAFDSPDAFGTGEIKVLQERIDYLQNAGAGESKIQSAAAAIEAINKLLTLPERLAELRTAGENTNNFLQRQLEAIEETNRLLESGQNKPLQPNAANNLRGMLMAPGATTGGGVIP